MATRGKGEREARTATVIGQTRKASGWLVPSTSGIPGNIEQTLAQGRIIAPVPDPDSQTSASSSKCAGNTLTLSYVTGTDHGCRRQHLGRTHEAPIECQRCWKKISSPETLEVHLLAVERCEHRQRPQQLLPIEGVCCEKMALIKDSHGISWEEIYMILFPVLNSRVHVGSSYQQWAWLR